MKNGTFISFVLFHFFRFSEAKFVFSESIAQKKSHSSGHSSFNCPAAADSAEANGAAYSAGAEDLVSDSVDDAGAEDLEKAERACGGGLDWQRWARRMAVGSEEVATAGAVHEAAGRAGRDYLGGSGLDEDGLGCGGELSVGWLGRWLWARRR